MPADLASVLDTLPKLRRIDVEALVEAMIAHLDAVDGDPDFEPNGDELDGSMGEDDFHAQSSNFLGLPGCPLADGDFDDLDIGERDDGAPLVPQYGIDQTAGFVNETEIMRDLMARRYMGRA